MGNKSGQSDLRQRIRCGQLTKEDVARRLAELAFGKANDCVKLVLADDADKLLSNTQVKEAYLGG